MKPVTSRRLSKSRVTAGSQCEKLLWWKVHEPDAPELQPDRIHQAVFDAGHRVGALAQAAFPGGQEIVFTRALQEMVAATKIAIDTDCPAIFEAAFIHDGVFVAIDILERIDDGWALIEVKSTKSVKDHHLLDAAVQLHVAQGAGLVIRRVELMHLSPDCQGTDPSTLFRRSDITAAVEPLQAHMPGLASRLSQVLEGALPSTPTGPHCHQPRTCAFLDRCVPPPPHDSIERLYRLPKKDKERLREMGHTTVHTIPSSYPLRPIADRQRRSLVAGAMILEPTLAAALGAIRHPAVYIDFESIGPAIPPFEDCSPYGQLPVQVSCHTVHKDGRIEHAEWLGEPGVDPRPALGEFVRTACEGAASLVAYSAGFEKQMLKILAKHVAPEAATELMALRSRFVDLLPIMRHNVYHPDFGGRFGLKAVTAALLPHLAYDDLAVRAGGDASVVLADLILRHEPSDPDEYAAIRKDLLAYCERDTFVMVELVRLLSAAVDQTQETQG